MKILYIVPYTPSLIRVRPYNLIRALADLGHEVTLLTTWSNAQERADLADLEKMCVAVHAVQLTRWRSFSNCASVLFSAESFQAAYCWEPQLAAEIDRLVMADIPFDAVQVEHLRGVRYAQYWQEATARHAKGVNIPVIWDSVDCISYLFTQAKRLSQSNNGKLMTWLDLRRTRVAEARLTTQFDSTLVTSPIDKKEFLKLANGTAARAKERIQIVSNGVDLDYFAPAPYVKRDPNRIVVTGKMSYHANEAMVMALVNDIMPRVWDKRPQTQLQIVGKNPSRELMQMMVNPQVQVTGGVPDLRPYLQEAAVAVAPVQYGAGIQNKVLEAMGCATPVVASSKAVAALMAKSGRDVLVGSDSAEIARHILSLLENPDQAQRIGRNGRTFVEKNHSWHSSATKLVDLYGSLQDGLAFHGA